VLQVPDVLQVSLKPDKGDNCFEIRARSLGAGKGELTYFYADDGDMARQWVDVMRRMLQSKTQSPPLDPAGLPRVREGERQLKGRWVPDSLVRERDSNKS